MLQRLTSHVWVLKQKERERESRNASSVGWPNRGARNEGEENEAARAVNAHRAEVGVMKKKKKRKE